MYWKSLPATTAREKSPRAKGSFQLQTYKKPALATDPASLKRYYKQIRYIATKAEREAYASLSTAEKVKFILSFWKKTRSNTSNARK